MTVWLDRAVGHWSETLIRCAGINRGLSPHPEQRGPTSQEHSALATGLPRR